MKNVGNITLLLLSASLFLIVTSYSNSSVHLALAVTDPVAFNLPTTITTKIPTTTTTTTTTTIMTPHPFSDNIKKNTSSKSNSNSDNQLLNNYELSFDTTNMTHRSAQQEWQPHRGQTSISQEWWYFTALLHDASGNKYLLFNTLFKRDGKDLSIANSIPSLGKNSTTVIFPVVELSRYDNGFHYYNTDMAIVNPKDIWNSKSHALSYQTPHYNGSWGYVGNNINAVLKSQNLSFSLNMQGANQVMWSKDKSYNKEGFIQEGLPGNVSFYYSLPRLFVFGNLTYIDQLGVRKTMDVSGQGWVDRQWGNFKTDAWEWNSFRFDNGARLNLYNFANAYKSGTYQKPDGTIQRLSDFTIRQNGYAKAPNGQWAALGWSFDFPFNIEGSKHFTVIPFSNKDWICMSHNFCFIEGAGQLIDNDNSKLVGHSVFESMDIRMLKNGPYDINQH
jgi:predicted secreted hydrolase